VTTSNDSKERSILEHIEHLVEHEHRLLGKGGLDEGERAELARAQVELDQCWDLLRQRRARREFGKDPEQAHVRPADVVEKYEG